MKKMIHQLKKIVILLLFVFVSIVMKAGNTSIKSITITSIQTPTVTYGTSTANTYTITLSLYSGKTDGSYTLLLQNAPANVTTTYSSNDPVINSNTITLPAYRSADILITLTITNGINSPAGNYNIQVDAKDNNPPSKTTISTNNTTYNINPKPITIVNTVINDKIYDGSTTATIKTPGNLYGVLSGETNVPTFTESYTFPNKNVGLKALISNCSISGGGGNYVLTPPIFNASINPKPLTVSGASVTTKFFDGNTSATITGGNLSGLVSGDESVVTLKNTGSGTFDTPIVGGNKTVTTNYSISGTGIANYSFTSPTLLGTILAPTTVSWNGTNSADWETSSNWTPPYLPDATVDVTIASAHPVIAATTQAACKNLTIGNSGGLTINAHGSLTVNGNLINNNTTVDGTGLSLLSDEASTGSLLVSGEASGSGLASVVRYMSPNHWHLVSSPLSEQTIGTFLVGNTSIPKNIQTGAPTVAPFERAMRAYDGQQEAGWGEFFRDDSQETLTTGKGYSIRVKGSSGTQRVTFTGKIQPGPHSVAVTPGYWNCVGNPYTSALDISATGTSFLSVNGAMMPDAFRCVYVWDEVANGYSQVNSSSSDKHVQQGQAFMIVLSAGNTAVSFTPAMQTHDVSLALKSTEEIWPSIQLMATGDSINSTTMVAFHEGMTPGLDPSYDAGLLSAGGPELYTRLVDDYGIPFDIQALPADRYDQLIIPVGLDYVKGGAVTFSAKGMYLPSSCRPILEDRLTGIKTDLTDQTYTVDLTAHTAGTGRFYLYTSYAATAVASCDQPGQLSAWVAANHEINIKGQINNGAVASLFDLQGRLIVTRVLREGTRDHISLPAVKTGIYLLQVRDRQQLQTMKVRIEE